MLLVIRFQVRPDSAGWEAGFLQSHSRPLFFFPTSIAAWQFFGGRTALVALANGITCSFMNNAGTRSAVQAGQPTPPWGGNATDRLGYDGSGRLIAKRFIPSSDTAGLPVSFTTAYDPSSNKLFERPLHAENRAALYPNYDSINRLLECDRGDLATGGGSIASPIIVPGTDTQRTYNLDHLGNWKNTAYTPVGGSPTTEIRRHNLVNQITKFATTPVAYDHGNNGSNPDPLVAARGNGNIVNDGTLSYQYDPFNRLTLVGPSAGGVFATYYYDALGRRVFKQVDFSGTGPAANAMYRYLYDGQQIVEELLLRFTTTTLRQFVWGQYIDELIQLKAYGDTLRLPAGNYYPLQDLLYRTTALTDNSGGIVEAYDYDAYGNTLMFSSAGTGGDWWASDAGTTLQPVCEFLFTGRQYDPETEICWYRSRYYHQQLGRFLSRDLIGYAGGANLFAYCHGRPSGSLDGHGTDTCGPDVTDWFLNDLGSQLADLQAQYAAHLNNDIANNRAIGLVEGGELAAGIELVWDDARAFQNKVKYQLAYKWMGFGGGTGTCAHTVQINGVCIRKNQLGNIAFAYLSHKAPPAHFTGDSAIAYAYAKPTIRTYWNQSPNAGNFGGWAGRPRDDNLAAFAIGASLAGRPLTAAGLSAAFADPSVPARYQGLNPAPARQGGTFPMKPNALTFVPEYNGFDTALCKPCNDKWSGKSSMQTAIDLRTEFDRNNPGSSEFDFWLQKWYENYRNPLVPKG
jgi:RHS repeat-associated protein